MQNWIQLGWVEQLDFDDHQSLLTAGGVIWMGVGGQIFAIEPLKHGVGFRRVKPNHLSGKAQIRLGGRRGEVLVESPRVGVEGRADTGVSPLRRALRALEEKSL